MPMKAYFFRAVIVENTDLWSMYILRVALKIKIIDQDSAHHMTAPLPTRACGPRLTTAPGQREYATRTSIQP